ncbi:MAG TPA: NADH-quinone oxidoreductase subunit J [Acidimicrobiales bacterium]|nr:NADH-quinone oxidoreductase subunit J [Acidimicrobiales bacterium]
MSMLATTQLGVDSAWAVYATGALFIIAGAFGVVLQRNPVHCALGLVVTIFGITLEFIDEGANFLAAVQVIVYGGAIVILFLFVIMLLGVDRNAETGPRRLRLLAPFGVLVSLGGVIEILVLTRGHFWVSGYSSQTEALSGPGEDVQKLGQSIFTGYLLPFEMTSVLLVIAVVAAVVLVRRSDQPGPGAPRKAATQPRQPARLPGAPAAAAARPLATSARPSRGATSPSAPAAPAATGAPPRGQAPPRVASAGVPAGAPVPERPAGASQ